MSKPIYVLGTGLSSNASAVLLKDGRICVGIEKERLTRRKHDGGSDAETIDYCLAAEGITLDDVDLVVQCANFEIPPRHAYYGKRPFIDPVHPPIVSISHHLAHAWSAAGTSPFDDCAIMVIDGCGSPIEQCIDIEDGVVLSREAATAKTDMDWFEKDSFYRFDGRNVVPLAKDFSRMQVDTKSAIKLPTTQDSIGGFYAAISLYVFADATDVGKLMGLAPYGRDGAVTGQAFSFREDRLFVEEGWKATMTSPASAPGAFRENFQYYADVARWAQQQAEQAIAELFRVRLARFPAERICYSGGVALNAVANARLLDRGVVRQLYMEPAAGDNGLALGCAFYGWMNVLGRERVRHDGRTCFGRSYGADEIDDALRGRPEGWQVVTLAGESRMRRVAELLADGCTIGWFQDGCEFGPRALGHRSILAHPGKIGMGDHINSDIKFREDFRPFAPAVLPEFADRCFVSGRDSPYMILVDRTRAEMAGDLYAVTHVDGTARVQTVDRKWNAAFFDLIEAFHAQTGIPALLNTSFNTKGMPIVETPAEALAMFATGALDALVLQDRLILKPHLHA